MTEWFDLLWGLFINREGGGGEARKCVAYGSRVESSRVDEMR